jgi:PTS system nitrogen regulatory IIA component
MTSLAEQLSATNVLCQATSGSRKRVLQDIADLLATTSLPEDVLFDGLMERERLGSTGLGEGVAIPHCRLNVPTMQVALVTLAEPIDYEASDGEYVDILFVLVVPQNEQQAHLDALAQLSAVFTVPQNRKVLRQATSAAQLAATMAKLLEHTQPTSRSA